MRVSMLEDLFALSRRFFDLKNRNYRRYFIKKTQLNHRLCLILGQRGVGKTTMLIQYLLDYADNYQPSDKILYIQTDHFLMENKSIYEVAEHFHNHGGEFIIFDEIHKYSNWSQELKSLYDTFPDLKILASGSSALEIHKGSHDLSRRGIKFHLRGLSFREYLELKLGTTFEYYSLHDTLHKHVEIGHDVLNSINKQGEKILKLFNDYLQNGFYPYFLEFNNTELYQLTLEQNIHTTIESDLVAIYPQLSGYSVKKIKQLLAYVANAIPFTPNWQKVKTILDVGDARTLKSYIKMLEDAEMIKTVFSASNKLNKLETEGKLYLNNCNQMVALAPSSTNKGTMRETFFVNSLSDEYSVALVKKGDFIIDGKYTVEIGGRNKDFSQLKNVNQAFLVCDDIERGAKNKIPLWLFGFLY